MKPTRILCLALALGASCAGSRSRQPAAPAAPSSPTAPAAAPAAPVAPAAPIASVPASGRPEIRYYEIAEA